MGTRSESGCRVQGRHILCETELYSMRNLANSGHLGQDQNLSWSTQNGKVQWDKKNERIGSEMDNFMSKFQVIDH